MYSKDLYSIEEARELVGGISRNSIYHLLRDGKLANVPIGRRRAHRVRWARGTCAFGTVISTRRPLTT